MAIDLLTYAFLRDYVEGQCMGEKANPRGVWKAYYSGTIPSGGEEIIGSDEITTTVLTYKTGDYVTFRNKVYILPLGPDGKTQTITNEITRLDSWFPNIPFSENDVEEDIVSQWQYITAFSVEGDYIAKNALVQNTGDSEDRIMSQKATTDAIDNVLVGDNQIGTKAFRITGYQGTNGGVGSYLVDNIDPGIANLINELLEAGNLKCTIYFATDSLGAWHESQVILTGIDINTSMLYVDNFFSNDGKSGDSITYDSKINYLSKPGSIYGYVPPLGVGIQYENAIIFICGHPEIGTFDFNTNGTSFGENNISQGGFSITNGYNNWALGQYSSIFGNGNKAGFDTHVFGRKIDAAKAQDSLIAGYGHEIYNFVNSVAMFGYKNKCGYSYQTILGLWNKNKADNLFEIGGGVWETSRKNVFEVDKNGLISTNEKYIPNQTIYKQKLTLPEENPLPKNLLGKADDQGQIKGIFMDGITKRLGKTYHHKATDPTWLGYIMVDKTQIGNGVLKEKETYYLTLNYTVNKLDEINTTWSFAPIYWQTGKSQPTQGHPPLEVKYETRNYWITVPFTVTADNYRYGVYIPSGSNKEFDITIDPDVRLYKAEDFELTLPINASNSNLIFNDTSIPIDNSISCNYILPDYIVNLRENNSKLRIIPTTDFATNSLNIEIKSGSPDPLIPRVDKLEAGMENAQTIIQEIKEDILKIDNDIVIDENGKAAINANELYLGDRKVRFDSQYQEITNLRPYISSFERFPDEQYPEGYGGYALNENNTLWVEVYHGTLTLDISGTVNFKGSVDYTDNEFLLRVIHQDGTMTDHTLTTKGDEFEGNYENVQSIQIIDTSGFISAIKFTTLSGDVKVDSYIIGLIAEDKKSLDNLKSEVEFLKAQIEELTASSQSQNN